MTLTKESLINKLAARGQVSTPEAREWVELILGEMKSTLESGCEVKIAGFGKWKVCDKRARMGRNPHTGDVLEIRGRRVVTFHPSQRFRDSVNKPNEEVEQKIASL